MVAMNVWPTDAADGSVASEARWRKMARLWVPTGVASGTGGAMQPTLAFPNLTIKAGSCWVDGHFCELPGDQVLAVTANGLAVVRFDPAANTAQLLYLDGVTVPAQSPTGTFEMPVAKIAGSALVDLRSIIAANAVIGRWRRVAGISVGPNTLTTIPWDTEDTDTDGLMVPGPVTGGQALIPPNRDGLYTVSGALGFAAAPTNGFARLIVNGRPADFAASTVGQQAGFSGNDLLPAGATIVVQAFHAAASAMLVTGFLNVTKPAG